MSLVINVDPDNARRPMSTRELANLDSAAAIARDQTTKPIVAAEVRASEANAAPEKMHAAFGKAKADTPPALAASLGARACPQK